MTVETLSELGAIRSVADRFGPSDRIVELGVFQGASLAVLASSGADTYGVDPWGLTGAYKPGSGRAKKYTPDNQEIARRHLEDEAVHATLIRGFSTEVAKTWDKPVNLLFIDAVHDDKHVTADFNAWRRHLVPGATAVFDDYWPDRFPGVVTAVDRLVGQKIIQPVELIGKRTALSTLK